MTLQQILLVIDSMDVVAMSPARLRRLFPVTLDQCFERVGNL